MYIEIEKGFLQSSNRMIELKERLENKLFKLVILIIHSILYHRRWRKMTMNTIAKEYLPIECTMK